MFQKGRHEELYTILYPAPVLTIVLPLVFVPDLSPPSLPPYPPPYPQKPNYKIIESMMRLLLGY